MFFLELLVLLIQEWESNCSDLPILWILKIPFTTERTCIACFLMSSITYYENIPKKDFFCMKTYLKLNTSQFWDYFICCCLYSIIKIDLHGRWQILQYMWLKRNWWWLSLCYVMWCSKGRKKEITTTLHLQSKFQIQSNLPMW